MVNTMLPSCANGSTTNFKYLDIEYDNSRPEESARELIYAFNPEWQFSDGEVEFIAFKDGITNTLFKVIKKRPDCTERQIDREAVLLRAYGNHTDILIDREREARSHSLLARYNLAPTLLARFRNGLLYKYIAGNPCSPEDLRRKDVWPATARLLGQWHAVLPVSEAIDIHAIDDVGNKAVNELLPGLPRTNIWTVMQKWIRALPCTTKAERSRIDILQAELQSSTKLLGSTRGFSNGQYVVAHCDLLSGNVIILPRQSFVSESVPIAEVNFIDYEYATPAPAAFDLANHFAEWGGFECDYGVLPTRMQRRDFIRHYVNSYREHEKSIRCASSCQNGNSKSCSQEQDVEQLMEEVDLFRGIPGLYWGIWALIQAKISEIDFDYASYAEVRLKEYWDWKAERAGTRVKQGLDMPLREARLAQER